MGGVKLEPRYRGSFSAVLMLLWVTVASGFYVQNEPAPYDLLMIALIGISVLVGAVRLQEGSGTMLVLMAIFALANLIASFFSFDLARTLFYMGVTFYLMLSTIIVMAMIAEDEERTLRVFWNAYVWAAALCAFIAIASYFDLLPNKEAYMAGDRVRAFFKDPNVMGPFLVPAAIYLFMQFETQPGRKGLVSAILFAFIAAGILLSFSRGAWGNLVVAFMGYVALRFVVSVRSDRSGGLDTPPLGRTVWAMIAIVALGALVVTYLVLGTDAGTTFANKATVYRSYDENRFSNQLEGFVEALSWPMGIGPGLSEQSLAMATHSLYIRAFLENGWLGGLSWILFLLFTLWRGLAVIWAGRANPMLLVAYCSVIGILLNSIVIDTLHWRHFFLMLGLTWGGILIAGRMPQRVVSDAPLRGGAWRAAE